MQIYLTNCGANYGRANTYSTWTRVLPFCPDRASAVDAARESQVSPLDCGGNQHARAIEVTLDGERVTAIHTADLRDSTRYSNEWGCLGYEGEREIDPAWVPVDHTQVDDVDMAYRGHVSVLRVGDTIPDWLLHRLPAAAA